MQYKIKRMKSLSATVKWQPKLNIPFSIPSSKSIFQKVVVLTKLYLLSEKSFFLSRWNLLSGSNCELLSFVLKTMNAFQVKHWKATRWWWWWRIFINSVLNLIWNIDLEESCFVLSIKFLKYSLGHAVFFIRTHKYHFLQAAINENRIVSRFTDLFKQCLNHVSGRSRGSPAGKTRNKLQNVQVWHTGLRSVS